MTQGAEGAGGGGSPGTPQLPGTPRPGTVLVVGCVTPSPHGQDQLRRLGEQARARGLRVLGTDTAAALGSGAWRIPADETAVLDHLDSVACREFAAAHPGIGAVVTVKEGCVLAVAELARELGLPGNDPEAVRTIRTKDVCRGVLREAGFAQPSFMVAADLAEAAEFLAATTGPWVVKPRDGMGSAGVSLVHARQELDAAVAGLQPPFLVEEFVTGAEYSAEGVMVGGKPRILALTAKRTGAGFVETGHRTPAAVDPATASAARDTVADAVLAAGVSHGVLHAEFWVTPRGGIVMGEIHARPGGDFIHALVEHTLPGFELYGTLLDDLLGRPVPEPPAPVGAAGADFLVLGPGRVTSVEGWDEIAADPSLVAAHLSVREGDLLSDVASSADRHGVLVAAARDSAAVDAALDSARARLRVGLAPESTRADNDVAATPAAAARAQLRPQVAAAPEPEPEPEPEPGRAPAPEPAPMPALADSNPVATPAAAVTAQLRPQIAAAPELAPLPLPAPADSTPVATPHPATPGGNTTGGVS